MNKNLDVLIEESKKTIEERFWNGDFINIDYAQSELKKLLESQMRRAYTEGRKEILDEVQEALEKVKELFEKAWEEDPRSKAGKKQKGTIVWMMGYRTAQKYLFDRFNKLKSERKEKEE